MYIVKEQHKYSMVRVTPPGKFGNKIYMTSATQEELEYLFKIGHPFVEKVETKKETEK